jgi:hypothetical protein
VFECAGGICDIPLMGDDGDTTPGTEGYMNDDEIPTFKYYKSFTGMYYDVNEISDEIPWTSQGTEFVDYMHVIEDCNGDLGGFVFDSDGDSICDDVDACDGFDDLAYTITSHQTQNHLNHHYNLQSVHKWQKYQIASHLLYRFHQNSLPLPQLPILYHCYSQGNKEILHLLIVKMKH